MMRRSSGYWHAAVVLALVAGCAPGESAREQGDTASADTASRVVIGPATPAVFVRACSPCTLDVGRGVAPFSLTFVLSDSPGDQRILAALQLTQRDRPAWTQTLTTHDSAASAVDGNFMIGAQDIDMDGYSDLLVATSRGAANAFADYWRFSPDSAAFRYLGNFPVFTLDSATRRLSTYERGGDAGMIHEARSYEFRDDTLVLVERVLQEATSRPGEYRRTTERLRNGKLTVVAQTLVRAPSD